MRKWVLAFATLSMLAAACAPEETPPVGDGETPVEDQTAAECAEANADAFFEPETLTVATGNPAFPPWWEGGTTDENPEWEFNDPHLGEGYEGAVTFEVAERLGFSEARVAFVAIGFNKSFAPGPKDFDFVLQQISFAPERTEGVDFSESYYDVNQGLVAAPDSPIAGATTIAELADAKLGAPIGTTSLDVIEDVIQPSQDPNVYNDLALAIQDLKSGVIDGVIVDLPSAFFITCCQFTRGVIVGQFELESQEYFAMAFETGSPVVECVNLALQEMKADGTLDAIHQEWLADKTNAPVLT
jgi:polar amino acid transport system substrate-binding protein